MKKIFGLGFFGGGSAKLTSWKNFNDDCIVDAISTVIEETGITLEEFKEVLKDLIAKRGAK